MNKIRTCRSNGRFSRYQQAAAEKALMGMMDAISDTLSKGDSVTLVGFGSFSVLERAARTGRNPQTGKEIKIAAKKVAKFKVGKALADAVK